MKEIDVEKWEELVDKIEKCHDDIRREMNQLLFPRGREEVVKALDDLIHGMTFTELEAGDELGSDVIKAMDVYEANFKEAER